MNNKYANEIALAVENMHKAISCINDSKVIPPALKPIFICAALKSTANKIGMDTTGWDDEVNKSAKKVEEGND